MTYSNLENTVNRFRSTSRLVMILFMIMIIIDIHIIFELFEKIDVDDDEVVSGVAAADDASIVFPNNVVSVVKI